MDSEEIKVACPRCEAKFFVGADRALQESYCPSCTVSFTVPEVFGPFILENLLAEDFFSQTCETQKLDGTKAKIHRIKKEFCTPEFALFFDEACNKQHITPIKGMSRLLSHGDADGQCWYELNLSSNGNLKRALSREKLSYARAHAIAEQLVRIMKEAADLDIVHGNLKTSVIKLDINEVVEIEDFQLTRLFGSHLQDENSPQEYWNDSFSAPEARKVHFLGTREADIYSLGAVIYNLFSGRLPYFQCDAKDLSRGDCKLESLLNLNCGCAENWAKTVERMLSFDPQERPSYDELLLALEEARDHDTAGVLLQEFEGNLDKTLKLSAKESVKIDLLTGPGKQDPGPAEIEFNIPKESGVEISKSEDGIESQKLIYIAAGIVILLLVCLLAYLLLR